MEAMNNITVERMAEVIAQVANDTAQWAVDCMVDGIDAMPHRAEYYQEIALGRLQGAAKLLERMTQELKWKTDAEYELLHTVYATLKKVQERTREVFNARNIGTAQLWHG